MCGRASQCGRRLPRYPISEWQYPMCRRPVPHSRIQRMRSKATLSFSVSYQLILGRHCFMMPTQVLHGCYYTASKCTFGTHTDRSRHTRLHQELIRLMLLPQGSFQFQYQYTQLPDCDLWLYALQLYHLHELPF